MKQAIETKFGTSGLRGPASELLSGIAARHIAAFLRRVGPNEDGRCRVLVGEDLRDSSAQLALMVIRVAADAGFEVGYCGAVPTPGLAAAGARRKAAAIMITGSHIPADRNGIKFYAYDGEIGKADERAIVQLAARTEPLQNVDSTNTSVAEDLHNVVLDEWRDRYRSILVGTPLAGLKVGVYYGSSVAAPVLENVLAQAGVEVVSFGADAQFRPLDTEAVDQDQLALIRDSIQNERLDLVVSTDPDGDRPLVVDEAGNLVRGDLLGWMTARWLGADHISTTINANSAIQDHHGLIVQRTRIGSPYIVSSIEGAKSHALLPVGFEPNGGFLLGADCTINGRDLPQLVTRDAFLPIFAALTLAARSDQPMSAICASQGFAASRSDRIQDVDPDGGHAFISRLAAEPDERKGFFKAYGSVVSVDHTDGLRVRLQTQADGGAQNRNAEHVIVHLRLSGNAPEFRCYVEARNSGDADRLLAQCLLDLRAKLAQ